jgi:glycosyltransferase involved in cell wall biosynthesis
MSDPIDKTAETYRPKFTIVTVTYNAVSTVLRTFASVASQHYPRIEHVIVDGMSSDGTLEQIHRYQERNSNASIPHDIKVVCEPDEGLYDAMNKAFTLASGDYVCFLNAGDKLHEEDTLQRLSESYAFRKGERRRFPAVLYGETNIVDEMGRFLHKRHLTPPEQLTWESFRDGMVVCHQAFYARIDLCPNYNLTYRFSADFDWCIRVMQKAAKMQLPLVNSHLTLVDYLNEGMTTRHHRASLVERFFIMANYYGWLTTIRQHAWFVIRTFMKK